MVPKRRASQAHADDAIEGLGERLRQPPKMVRNRKSARVRLGGRDFHCGPWGSKAAQERYRELVAEWTRHGCKLPPLLDDDDPEGATVDELIALHDAYEMPTKPASTQEAIKLALRPLQETFGSKRASEFRALDLLALRADMLSGGRLTRGMVNVRMRLIRGLFTWGASMGRIDERVPFRLSGVKSLRRGQSTREGRLVQPVEWSTVEATLRYLSEPVRGLVLFQWHTGARPGEACTLTADEIDRTGKVWVYVPSTHKTAHHGKSRRIFVGDAAQRVLLPFLVRRPATLPLFSPVEAMAEHKAQLATSRRTRVQPSQAKRRRRREARPKLEVAEGYDVHTYRRAIARGVDAANAETKRDGLRQALVPLVDDDRARARIEAAVAALPVFVNEPSQERLVRRIGEALQADEARRVDLAKLIGDVLAAPGKFERWHPHRLRHSFAHRAERETGDLDAVRACLGHSTLAMAARYAHPDDRKARDLAEKLG